MQHANKGALTGSNSPLGRARRLLPGAVWGGHAGADLGAPGDEAGVEFAGAVGLDGGQVSSFADVGPPLPPRHLSGCRLRIGWFPRCRGN